MFSIRRDSACSWDEVGQANR